MICSLSASRDNVVELVYSLFASLGFVEETAPDSCHCELTAKLIFLEACDGDVSETIWVCRKVCKRCLKDLLVYNPLADTSVWASACVI